MTDLDTSRAMPSARAAALRAQPPAASSCPHGIPIAGYSGWADPRLGSIYDQLDALIEAMPPGSTELGCITDALKAVELADNYIEKRQRENAA